MTKYSYNHLVEFLEKSMDYIRHCNRRYNMNLSEGKDCKNIDVKLDYHLFSFSQTLFALRDRLYVALPDEYDSTSNFFEKGRTPQTSVGIVLKLANEWKHKEGISLRRHFHDVRIYGTETIKAKDSVIPSEFLLDPDQEIENTLARPTKVEKRLPVAHRLNQNDVSLLSLFEKALSDVKKYINELNA